MQLWEPYCVSDHYILHFTLLLKENCLADVQLALFFPKFFTFW